MFESQHLQTVWFTGLAAHPGRTAQPPHPGPARQAGAKVGPSLAHLLATIAGRAIAWKRRPQKRPATPCPCGQAPTCC